MSGAASSAGTTADPTRPRWPAMATRIMRHIMGAAKAETRAEHRRGGRRGDQGAHESAEMRVSAGKGLGELAEMRVSAGRERAKPPENARFGRIGARQPPEMR